MSLLSPQVSGKRLELLREIVAELARVAVIWNPDDSAASASLSETRAAADILQLRLQILDTRRPTDFGSAFEADEAAAQAMVFLPAPVISTNVALLADGARKSRLPTISYSSDFPRAGGAAAKSTLFSRMVPAPLRMIALIPRLTRLS